MKEREREREMSDFSNALGVPGFKFGEQGSVFMNPHVIGSLPPYFECNGIQYDREQFWGILTGKL